MWPASWDPDLSDCIIDHLGLVPLRVNAAVQLFRERRDSRIQRLLPERNKEILSPSHCTCVIRGVEAAIAQCEKAWW